MRNLVRGGKRPGAGRKALHGAPLRVVTVRLTPAQIAFLERVGAGSVTAGLRKVIDHMMR